MPGEKRETGEQQRSDLTSHSAGSMCNLPVQRGSAQALASLVSLSSPCYSNRQGQLVILKRSDVATGCRGSKRALHWIVSGDRILCPSQHLQPPQCTRARGSRALVPAGTGSSGGRRNGEQAGAQHRGRSRAGAGDETEQGLGKSAAGAREKKLILQGMV